MNNFLPALDLLAHNALAVLVTVPLLILVSQIIVAGILQIVTRVLRSSIFEGVSAGDRAALRRQVRRRSLLIVLALSALLLAGALVASYRGLRAMDLARDALAWTRGQDFAVLQMRLLKVLAVAVAAYVVDAIARAIVTALGKGLSAWNRLSTQREALPEVVKRVRAGVRAVIVVAAVSLAATTIDLPENVRRTVTIAFDLAAAYYVARAASRVWHLVTEVFFGLADRLAEFTGVLRALANLKHLIGITKRAGDYFIYVGAATWVAGQIAPGAWYYNVGQVGLRLIVIFYASRLLVERRRRRHRRRDRVRRADVRRRYRRGIFYSVRGSRACR
ncbi:MAG: hypothetical protein L6Q76_02555 [Polyangiaceae bacterium]|nr:hypothetical protein [Polyangiaceae bacterium]